MGRQQDKAVFRQFTDQISEPDSLIRIKTGNVRTVADGVELRVLSKTPPARNAVQVETTLEDAFLLYFGEKAGDKDDVQI